MARLSIRLSLPPMRCRVRMVQASPIGKVIGSGMCSPRLSAFRVHPFDWQSPNPVRFPARNPASVRAVLAACGVLPAPPRSSGGFRRPNRRRARVIRRASSRVLSKGRSRRQETTGAYHAEHRHPRRQHRSDPRDPHRPERHQDHQFQPRYLAPALLGRPRDARRQRLPGYGHRMAPHHLLQRSRQDGRGALRKRA